MSMEQTAQMFCQESADEDPPIPDICHGSHGYIRGEKICHVEKFQISMHDRCGEI